MNIRLWILWAAIVVALALATHASYARGKDDRRWVRIDEDLDLLTVEGHGMLCVVVRGTAGMSAGAPAISCVPGSGGEWTTRGR